MKDEEEKHSSRSDTPIPRDVEKLFSRLNLGHSQYQRFGHHRVSSSQTHVHSEAPVLPVEPDNLSTPAAPHPVFSETPEGRVLSVGVYSPMGGSGKSLLTASLGAVLCSMGRRTLLVDTSPWNALATHFGGTESRTGIRTFHVPDDSSVKVHVLSCDASTPPDLNEISKKTPLECVIFDLGGVPESSIAEWLGRCDRLIVPLAMTVQAPLMAYTARERIESTGIVPEQFVFVLNRMDASPMGEKVRKILGELLHEQLFPEVIEQQASVDEALSEGIVLPYYAPESQAVRVCQQLVDWLKVPERVRRKTAQRWLEG